MFSGPWQYKASVLLLACNVDFVIIFLRWLEIPSFTIFCIAIPVASLELWGLFEFYKWFRKNEVPKIIAKKIAKNERLREVIKEGEAIKESLGKTESWSLILASYRKFAQATDENNRIVKLIKRFGHAAIAFMGAEPFPLGRGFAVAFCGAINWRGGLYTLIVANVIHIAQVVWMANFLFWLLGWQ